MAKKRRILQYDSTIYDVISLLTMAEALLVMPKRLSDVLHITSCEM